MPESSFLEAIQLLKRIPRSGWIYAGVPIAEVESVAEHSFGVSMLSMLLSEKIHQRGVKLDIKRTLQMALLHDVSESMTFDISKRYLDFMGKKGRRIKRELDKSANRKLLSEFPPTLRKTATRILREHDLGKTVEARVVVAADLLDLLLQLETYHRSGHSGKLLDEMRRKVTAEVRAMREPAVSSLLREIHGTS